jgi:sugar O-acyltransferase (sialic acid O-acetyltransferase NeuD family)
MAMPACQNFEVAMTADSVLIIGAGGHGKVVADAALRSGRTIVGFLDDRADQISMVIGIPVLGPIASLDARVNEFSQIIVALGDGPKRMELIERLLGLGLKIPVIVDPSAIISRFATLAAGTVVLAQAAINAGARIGMGVIVNTGATVDHDCVLGDGVHICPGVHLGGNVVVQRTSWIGVGSSVRQGICVGANVTVGAGSVVVSDIADGETVMGVPAKSRAPK